MSHLGTVVVVEDEEDIRETLRDVLEEEGFEVLAAGDGRNGLSLLRNASRPCVAILDIIMPVMSGNEVYATMQADPELAGIPVIVSTSDPSRAPSGVLLIKKPINLDRLLHAIHGLLEA